MTSRWEHLIESDEELRRLERITVSGGSEQDWSRYIAAAQREGKTSRSLQQLAANTDVKLASIRRLLDTANRLGHQVLGSFVFAKRMLVYVITDVVPDGLVMSHVSGLRGGSPSTFSSSALYRGAPYAALYRGAPHERGGNPGMWEDWYRKRRLHFSVVPNDVVDEWRLNSPV